MRDFHRLPTMRVLALVFMAPGAAAAEYFPFDGTHTLELTDFGGSLRASASGTGVARINGSSGGTHASTGRSRTV